MPYDLKPRPRSDSQPAEAARVGEELREARLSLGVSLEELAEALRINRRYLAALEEGRVRDLPGVAYGTGFVRSYAQSMGLDAPDLVRRFREGAGAGTRSKDLVFPEPVPDRGVPAGVVILIGAVLAVGAYAAWYQWSGSAERSVDAVPPLPPRLEQAAREAGLPPLPGTPPAATPATPAPNGATPATPPAAGTAPGSVPGAVSGAPASGAPAPAAPAPGVTPAVPPAARPSQPPVAGAPGTAAPAPGAMPAAPNGNAAPPAAPVPPGVAGTPAAPAAPAAQGVVLRASDESWVQIRDSRSGRVLLNRVLRPRETYEVPNQPGLVLSTGKAEGLTIELDGAATGVLANQVGVRRDISLDPERLRAAAPATR